MVQALLPWLGKYVVLPLILWKGIRYLANVLKRKESIVGKVVLITGASSGIGEELAKVCYRAGCKVIIAARRLAELERVKRELESGPKFESSAVKVLELDLADLSSILARTQEASQMFGPIDILVNNGGMSYRGQVADTELTVDQLLMRVNYFGTIALTKALLPTMIGRRSGHIVTVSSLQGRLGLPFRSAYAASKHAIQGFMDTLRSEVASDNVKVTVISPSYVATKLSLNAVTGTGSRYGRMDNTTASGMSAEACAEEIYKAIQNHDNEVVLAPVFHELLIYIRAVCPWLYFTIMAIKAKGGKKKD